MIEFARGCVTVSIVSHGHGPMILEIIKELRKLPEVAHVILTLNIPEPGLPLESEILTDVQIIQNVSPQGFSKNHNNAFACCASKYFCILNPDIRIPNDPFKILISELNSGATLVAPMILNKEGHLEDSARYFPTPLNIIFRAFRLSDARYPLGEPGSKCEPDWLAGMFLLIKAADFVSLNGFDERYFLYLEDADLSVRVWKSGRSVRLSKQVSVFHFAQRASHKNAKYFIFHVISLVRFFIHNIFRLPRR